jgi:hypothetical protein
LARFEIELSWNWLKVRRWALYELAFENEYDADARLTVFTPEPELRERIRTKMLPRIKTEPLLIEPDQIERIVDYEQARERPELAILGCLFHAQEPAPFEARVEVFRAAWMAIQSLAETQARRYSVVVMSSVPEAVIEQGIAELRETGELDEGRWELFTDSERKGHSFARGRREGHAEGHDEGRRETLRRAILDMLELRGIEVTPMSGDRIQSCESLDQLERWYAAAKSTVTHSVEQLLEF